jgi:hypothetical protein
LQRAGSRCGAICWSRVWLLTATPIMKASRQAAARPAGGACPAPATPASASPPSAAAPCLITSRRVRTAGLCPESGARLWCCRRIFSDLPVAVSIWQMAGASSGARTPLDALASQFRNIRGAISRRLRRHDWNSWAVSWET